MSNVVLCEYVPQLEAELISMWRESFEHGVGVKDPHSLEDQAAYFRAEVLPSNAVQVAKRSGELVGFVAASTESISQLYVRVGCHGQGIGTRLLEWARSRSGGRLWLYTLAVNQGARRFYESRGFIARARGFEPTWQLEDIRYEWAAPVSRRS